VITPAVFGGDTRFVFLVLDSEAHRRYTLAQEESPLLFGQFSECARVAEFLTASLHREVGLTECDNLFGRIGVLHDEIAGVTGEVHIFDFTFCFRTNGDHFDGSDEMVDRIMTAVFTRDLPIDESRLDGRFQTTA